MKDIKSLQEKYGEREALLLDYIQQCINMNKNNNACFYQGKYWATLSYNHLIKNFPTLNVGKIERTLNKLINKGLVVKKKVDSLSHHRAVSYTLTHAVFL